MPRTAVTERPARARTEEKERREIIRELLALWHGATVASPELPATMPYRVSVVLWKKDYDRADELLARLGEIG
jgi:hypothetical protein